MRDCFRLGWTQTRFFNLAAGENKGKGLGFPTADAETALDDPLAVDAWFGVEPADEFAEVALAATLCAAFHLGPVGDIVEAGKRLWGYGFGESFADLLVCAR